MEDAFKYLWVCVCAENTKCYTKVKYIYVEGNTEEEFGGEGEWESTPQLYIPVWLNFPLLTGQAFPVNGCVFVCVRERASHLCRVILVEKGNCQKLFTLALAVVSSMWGPTTAERRRKKRWLSVGISGVRTDLFVFIQQEKNWESS